MPNRPTWKDDNDNLQARQKTQGAMSVPAITFKPVNRNNSHAGFLWSELCLS
jgi:hypothetical protein